MLLQIRTETLYAIEMTEQQIKELSIFFDGIQENDVEAAIMQMKGSTYAGMKGIRETVQAFRYAIAEHSKL